MSATKKIKAAIVGYGNIGRYAVDALLASPDFELVGVVRRDATNIPYELRPYRVVSSIGELGQVDVALLCTPTRLVEETARAILAEGIRTVDSFDIHTDIVSLRRSLGEVARRHGVVSVLPRVGIRVVTPWCVPSWRLLCLRGLPTRTLVLV